MNERQELKRLSELYKASGITLAASSPVVAWFNPYIGLPFFLLGFVFLITGVEQSIRLHFLLESDRAAAAPPETEPPGRGGRQQ